MKKTMTYSNEMQLNANEELVGEWLSDDADIGITNIDVNNKKTARVGRKRIQLDPSKLIVVSLRKRTSVRVTSTTLGMHISTLHRLVERGLVREHTNAIKSHLTPAHKVAKVFLCLNSIIPDTVHTIPKFINIYNVVHVDEKYFCMSKMSQRYYLASGE